MIRLLDNGPFLHATAWTAGPDYTIQLSTGDGWGVGEPTIAFDAGRQPRMLAPLSVEQLLAPLAPPLLRSSGVDRARSAAKSTVLSALLAKSLVQTFNGQPGFDGKRVGVGIVSSSAIVPIFWKFESVGVSDSWQNTDTMLLPASIPSAVGTATSKVTDSHATAITFADGAVGMFSAIEHAYLCFFHGRADYFMVIAAEEGCLPMMDAMAKMGVTREVIDGAAGFVLSRERLSEGDWQVSFVDTVPSGQVAELPAGWADVPRFVVTFDDHFAAYTGAVVPQAIAQVAKTDAVQVVVEIVMAGRASSLLGLRRSAQT